ncbi:hypothetical protein M422DRAFT_47563 [Sphaerobolus stellatus SS14]|uniref:Protein transport protein sec16 n=1 Tax=Sphaerobolus stellatus (strain SS14) TaxID=990650 RepID=A0A0C9VPK3_SPHS4|nr:hypothetical protein M422DRAFT_47563 [Sphaerobolus stellatus SS14]
MAHEEPDVAVEAAASLFGSGDESAGDFFSTSFGTAETTADVSENTSTLHQAPESSDASNLFEAGPDESASTLFQDSTYDAFSLTAETTEWQGEDTAAPVAPVEADSHAGYTTSTYQDQAWQGDYGQQYNNNSTSSTTYDYGYTSQALNDPYAPQANTYSQSNQATQQSTTSDYASNYSSPYTASAPQQQTSYFPEPSYTLQQQQSPYTAQQTSYAPQTQAQGSNYAAPSSQSTWSAYDPPITSRNGAYVPPTQSHYTPNVSQPSNYTTPAYNTYTPSAYTSNASTVNAPLPYVAQKETAPAPPKDVSAFRSTTRNAYDPPIPAKSKSKSRQVSYAPPVNPYQAPVQSPPPPPRAALSPPLPPPPPRVVPAGVQSPPLPYARPQNTSTRHDTPYAPYTSTIQGSIPPQQQSYYESASTQYKAPEVNGHVQQNTTTLQTAQYSETHKQKTLTASEVDSTTVVEHDTEEPSSVDWQRNPDDAQEDADPEAGDFYASHSQESTVHAKEVSSTPSLEEASSESTITTDNTMTEPTVPAAAGFGPYSMSPPPLPAASPDSIKSSRKSESGIVSNVQTQYDPYNPVHHSRQNSQTSPTEVQQQLSSTAPRDPYAPPSITGKPSKKVSQSSLYSAYGIGRPESVNGTRSAAPLNPYDPYAPKAPTHRSASRQSYASYDATTAHQSAHGYEPPERASTLPPDVDSATASYANILTTYNQGVYAPSPSLLGTNDPLGRTSVKVPVISFGFGGKLVSCFHSTGESGYDISLTSRQSTTVSIRTLHEVIPASAMESSESTFPGPLFSDPGSSGISLARVGVGSSSTVKTKKTAVSKWLQEQADELSGGIPHIAVGSQERHNMEGRLALLRLLKVMIDNDGQLSGSSAIEWAVRAALVSRLDLESSPEQSSKDLGVATPYGSFTDLNEQPLAVYSVKASALDRIKEFLIRGQRHQAYHYAIDEKLWGHAMIIASSIDPQAWREVVQEFVHSELGVKQSLLSLADTKTEAPTSGSNGRESLRVAYSFLSGFGAGAVQELIPSKALSGSKETSLSLPSPATHVTPLTPNFPLPTLTSSVPSDALEKWQETAAMIAFSKNQHESNTLTALGDYLSANKWTEAAHICYLLSPRTSSFGGLGTQNPARIVLVGSESPATQRGFFKDLDVTLLSEIVEFALSLSPLSKGQDAFTGLPHLQAYKLIRAAHLAEMGYVELANRYCEAIGSSIRVSGRGSMFYTPTFIGELKNLSERLTAAPQADKTASWITKKMAKPSLDTLGGWLETRFSKLIIGEGEEGAEDTNDVSQASKPTYGPFSHYSTISSTVPSATPSRSSTPYMPTSATSTTSTVPHVPTVASYIPVDRASSAMDHLRPEMQRASPVQRVASANAATTTFSQAYNPGHYQPSAGVNQNTEDTNGEGQYVSYWGSNSQDRSGPTPTATTFHNVDAKETEGNFISLMDDYSPGPTPMASRSNQTSRNVVEDEDDEEDLGFSNASSKRLKERLDEETESKGTEEKSKGETKQELTKPVLSPNLLSELKQQSSSWFSKWWSKGSDAPKPIKANLGEETSFYYDADLKRWVNKKASRLLLLLYPSGAAPASAPPPPPPPSRPRSAAPGPPPTGGAMTPPPLRSSSTADLAGPPSRKPPRVRSNLVPQEDGIVPGSAPPTATSFMNSSLPLPEAGPPMGRPKSAAAKRNVRNRYVDVFQQQ